jgi:hypothetical protein
VREDDDDVETFSIIDCATLSWAFQSVRVYSR